MSNRSLVLCALLLTACGDRGYSNGVDGGGIPDGGNPIKRVFVTSREHDGNLGGLGGADTLCNDAAANAKLKGKYAAWVSTKIVSAIDHVKGPGPWFLVDGTTQAFKNRAQLADVPLATIHQTEFGKILDGNTPFVVWTGTQLGGTLAPDSVGWGTSCNNWTTTALEGRVGSAIQKNTFWTDDTNYYCDQKHLLYCFEQ